MNFVVFTVFLCLGDIFPYEEPQLITIVHSVNFARLASVKIPLPEVDD